MNILVLNGSPHISGNTMKMIEAFKEGAHEHQVSVIDVCQYQINGCLACEACHRQNKTCVQKDDMQIIYDLLPQTDMLVLASPIYYHGLSGQLKCAIDRLYAILYPTKPTRLNKIAMILSSGDPDMYEGAVFSYQGDFLDYLGLEGMGIFTAHGNENGSIEKLKELYDFGANLK